MTTPKPAQMNITLLSQRKKNNIKIPVMVRSLRRFFRVSERQGSIGNAVPGLDSRQRVLN